MVGSFIYIIRNSCPLANELLLKKSMLRKYNMLKDTLTCIYGKIPKLMKRYTRLYGV